VRSREQLTALGRALGVGIRLVFFRRVARWQVEPAPELFAALFALDLLLSFVFALGAFGLRGELNLYELARSFMFVPLVLAAGMVAQRIDRGSPLLLLPVALAAASVVMTVISSSLYILAQYRLLPFAETYWFAIDFVTIAWAAAIVVHAALRLIRGGLRQRAVAGVATAMLVVLPAYWLPQGALWTPRLEDRAAYGGPSFHTLAEEKSFYAQQGILERELDALQAERPGVPDVYVIAAGLYAGEDVFMKEIRMITATMRERFDTAGRTVTLVNNTKTLDEFPIASLTSLRQSLRHVGEVMNTEEDVLVLYVSSHGSENHELVVDFRPMRFSAINPQMLKAAVAESGIKWKIIVISACYSGGFVDALKDEQTLIITAASADRTSFGCGAGSDATYLAKALFGDALKKTRSFEEAFGMAREVIGKWEQEQGQEPSQPQIHVGSRIREKLAAIERKPAIAAPAR
jgi:hypothetical protein